MATIVLIKQQVEHELFAAFLELVVKLNETAFRPLLRKLCDWAFADESGRFNLVIEPLTYAKYLEPQLLNMQFPSAVYTRRFCTISK